jgi:hypothetical protein
MEIVGLIEQNKPAGPNQILYSQGLIKQNWRWALLRFPEFAKGEAPQETTMSEQGKGRLL